MDYDWVAQATAGFDPFDGLDAKDGFHAILLEFGGRVSLSVVCYANGEPIDEAAAEAVGAKPLVTLVEQDSPGPVVLGAATRLHRVVDAVCRYLTTGGSWPELEAALTAVRTVAPGAIQFPGYHVCDTYATLDGVHQHVFVKDGTKEAVLWQEPEVNEAGGLVGGFVDRTDLETIAKQKEDDEQVWGAREAEEDDEAGPLQLPAGPGDGDPEADS